MASQGVLDQEQAAATPAAATSAAATPTEGAEPQSCLNCGVALTGPYCASCGQRTPHLDPTLREFVHEAAQELASWDGKVPTTLKALFLKPGLLTLDFLAGRRARWLSPLRLYLICSVAFFLSAPLVEAVTGRPAGQRARVTITSDDSTGTITPEEREAIAEGLPGRIFGVERLERAVAKGAELDRAIDTTFPKAMFLLLPFFALLTNLAWRRKQPRYPAHLYTALHLHAAWFGALAVFTIAVGLFAAAETVVGLAALAYGVSYSLVALRRIFGDSWAKTIAKSAAVAVVYSLALLVTSLATLAYAIATI